MQKSAAMAREDLLDWCGYDTCENCMFCCDYDYFLLWISIHIHLLSTKGVILTASFVLRCCSSIRLHCFLPSIKWWFSFKRTIALNTHLHYVFAHILSSLGIILSCSQSFIFILFLEWLDFRFDISQFTLFPFHSRSEYFILTIFQNQIYCRALHVLYSKTIAFSNYEPAFFKQRFWTYLTEMKEKRRPWHDDARLHAWLETEIRTVPRLWSQIIDK